jgi:hypothetical protein
MYFKTCVKLATSVDKKTAFWYLKVHVKQVHLTERALHMEGEFITMDEAAGLLGVKRGTLHYYLRSLKLQTHKFPLDRHAYLSVEDFKTIKTLREQSGKSGQKGENPAA